jgi:nucleotide-binding universal stress UspA family protein
MISTVAVGTDGTPTADRAVKEAAEIARRFDAKLVLLSVLGESPRKGRGNVEVEWETNPAARVQSIQDRLQAELKREGIECETRADMGEPGKVLVQLAEECGADLLVIGNKGMKRRVLGSVPKTVSHTADCSVLIVKTT